MVRSGSIKAKPHGSHRHRSPRLLKAERLPLEIAEGNLTLCLSLVGGIDGKVFQLGGYQRLSDRQRRLLDEVSVAARRAVAELERVSRELGLKPLEGVE